MSNLKSSRVSWIMFWMKWICREVRGASPPWPSTWTMFWDSEEETAAVDRAAPGEHTALLGTKKWKWKWENLSGPTVAAVDLLPRRAQLPGRGSRSSAEPERRWLAGGSVLA